VGLLLEVRRWGEGFLQVHGVSEAEILQEDALVPRKNRKGGAWPPFTSGREGLMGAA